MAVENDAVMGLVPDPRRLRPGRGAHIHPDPQCLATADKRRAFGRALRVSGVLDTTEVARHLAQGLPTHPRQEGRSEPTDGGFTSAPDQQGRTTNMSTR